MSKSERLLFWALDLYTRYQVQLLRLKDIIIHDCEWNYSESLVYCTYPCQISLTYDDDQMQTVYDAVLACDIFIHDNLIMWNNHSAPDQNLLSG